MPLYEFQCGCGWEGEHYLRHYDDPNPPCERCGGALRRLMSRFGVVFTGALTTKYMDKNRENAHMEGFWAYRKKSSVSGQPEAEWIDTWDKLKSFNKAEGLAMPGEVPTNSTISADGRRIISNGMPGQWAGGFSIPSRLKEIIEMPAEQIPQVPASVSPCMPIDFGMRVEAVDPKAAGMAE